MTTFRMPAEWTDHEGCLMAWPTRQELWGDVFAEVKAEYARVASAIAEFEPVTMVALPGSGAEARELCGEGVTVIELPIDDSWFRDSGPIFVLGQNGERAGVDFRFNAWGGKHFPYDTDDKIAGALLDHFGVDRIDSRMILEGGAITVDGEGTLITTEQCLLHPNRNPDLTKEEIEAELIARLGVTKVIWLPYGGLLDTETDGHVDGVAAFVAPGKVLVSLPSDPAHPDYERMRVNRAVLESATDAAGRPFEIIDLPQSNLVEVDGRETEVGYLNFYIANGGVVVPVADTPEDEGALAVIAAALPGLKVVGVRSRVIAYGGGGVHCITQQVPSAHPTA
ncbi:agmatine deiminase family protein [Streptomyces sp. NBC_00503]|uniref:agmatine deiminase family protein n=1 Tax=Streptomyces sp. NBC_00503 TaxID=2903659 RepID=UPI002E80021B|nr:agmatine deiminase family protein [Streptomyces sp. NBC_00503]WUD84566.1 agmatine deiminase family protein [Streptomyces sp. NBC_00503]